MVALYAVPVATVAVGIAGEASDVDALGIVCGAFGTDPGPVLSVVGAAAVVMLPVARAVAAELLFDFCELLPTL